MNRAALVVALLLVPLLAGCTRDAGPDPEDSLVWPFPEAIVPPGGVATLLVLRDENATAPTGLGIDWVETHLGDDAMGFVTLAVPDALGAFATRTLDDPLALRFGVAGHNGTQVTLMVFNDEAELLATTAGLHEYGHLPWISDSLVEIEDTVYYLGDDETAPNGTEPLPWFLASFKPRIRDLLHGLPVGGVSSALVPEEEYRDEVGFSLGDLYLTARVDALVQAP